MLDAISLTIITLTVIIAFIRGFIKEIFGIIGIILSFVLTYYNYDLFSDLLKIKSHLVTNIVSTFLIYIIVIVSITVINSGVIYILRPIRLGPADRILGIMVGFFKGLFFSFVFFLFLKLVYYTINPNSEINDANKILPNWIIKSKVYNLFSYIEENIDEIAPEYIYQGIKNIGKELNNIINKEEVKEGDKQLNA
ncbi:MAG: CvpA family protein [Rickettsiaceae bacterium H1]|nr:CvpA family protein [Rickettsiaceae bacterium H1]